MPRRGCKVGSGGFFVEVAPEDFSGQLGYRDVLALGTLSILAVQVPSNSDCEPW